MEWNYIQQLKKYRYEALDFEYMYMYIHFLTSQGQVMLLYCKRPFDPDKFEDTIFAMTTFPIIT